MQRIILGSQSPRRKEILRSLDLPFELASPDFDEEAHPFRGDPKAYVCELASGKSLSLLDRFPDSVIITADTTVYCDGKVYNKPQNEEEAFQMLSELVGKWHSVVTAISVRKGEIEHRDCEETRVLFNPLTPDEIRSYHSKIHWADKAGGYAIQLAGGLIVNRIEGCYYNVIGLPINTLRNLLKKFHIDLWEYLK